MSSDITDNGTQSKPYIDSFDYRLDMLKFEIEIIDRGIARMDEMSKSHKNWAILVWTGSLAITIGNADLRPYTIVTTAIPILFWIVDAVWAHHQIRFDYREKKIAEFLNSDLLAQSFEQRQLAGITLLDPNGRQYQDAEDYQEKTNLWRTASFSSVAILYFGMIVLSIVIALVLRLMS